MSTMLADGIELPLKVYKIDRAKGIILYMEFRYRWMGCMGPLMCKLASEPTDKHARPDQAKKGYFGISPSIIRPTRSRQFSIL